MKALSPLDAAREMTVLAWRRTLLRGVLVVVVATRIFTDELGPIVIVVALVTIAVAAVLNLALSREYSQVRTGSGLPAPRVPGVLRRPTLRLGLPVVVTVLLGCVALWWVWLR